jgi:sugar lactone lactonase YvrE
MSGDQFRLAATNSIGSSGSTTALLTVEPGYAFTTLTAAPRLTQSLAVDGAGNIYVADGENHTIQRITATGVATVFAGSMGQSGSADGAGGAARFNGPRGVAVDGAGNVYVADTGNSLIRRITPAGVVTTLAGEAGEAGYVDGVGGAAQFEFPQGVAVDGAGNVYVADTGNSLVRRITSAGVVTRVAGAPPYWIEVNGVEYNISAGHVYTSGGPELDIPQGVAADSAGNVYIADTGNDDIWVITPAGAVNFVAGTPGQSGSADGSGVNTLFDAPSGVAVDSAGNVYVADAGNDTIREITPSTVPNTEAIAVTTLAGSPGQSGSTDGWDTVAQFYNPQGVAVDGSGNIYVADSGNDEIRKGVIGVPIEIITQPQNQTLNLGSTVVFTGFASGASSYQWDFNGTPLSNSAGGAVTDVISGATGLQLVITNSTGASNGVYTLVATNSTASATSSAAVLTTTPSSNPGLATSISTRAFVGTGDDILIGGFYVVGSTSRTVLVQALGPALTPLGVSGALQHPTVSIHRIQNGQDVTLYSNTSWGSSQVLLNAAASVFATPSLTPGSGDSELLVTLPPGGYSAEVAGADGGTGVALCAIYELP